MNAALAEVTARVERVRELLSARPPAVDASGNGHRPSRNGDSPDGPAEDDAADVELTELLEGFERDGIVLRDVDRGLLDFAAESPSGRPYWLCWVVGEPEVAWWHWPEDGFAGRTPLARPPD